MQNPVEWFGYAASVVVAVSLLMSSLIKLRWINMVGSLMFTGYGLLIGAYPVALLNFTIAGAEPVMTPSFFGTNPGEVKEGPRAGTRVLEAEEELGRALVKSLDDAQRKKAVILEKAPQEILNVPGRNDSKPEGIPWTSLTEPQREILTKLIREYLFRHRPDVADKEFAKVTEKAGMLHFAWAGGLERGEPHYYRVQGGGFVLEYDNVQNGANHVHSVWRDFDRDFGADVLAEHYKAAHQK